LFKNSNVWRGSENRVKTNIRHIIDFDDRSDFSKLYNAKNDHSEKERARNNGPETPER